MVILIGGASCTGKTIMAQKLLEIYKIPYLSIDHIKMGIIRGNSYCDFTAEDKDEELTRKLWPIVKGIIKTNIENDQHIIIEGCYIPTDDVMDFEPEYLNHILPLYIGFSEEYIRKHFQDGIVEHRSEIEHKDISDYMNLENFVNLHKFQKERCTKDHQMYFEVTKDYQEDLKKAYDWIEENSRRILQRRFNS